jgi:hypothetical protein
MVLIIESLLAFLVLGVMSGMESPDCGMGKPGN